METYNNMPLTWPELVNTEFGVTDFDLSKALNGWPLVAISDVTEEGSTIQPATHFRIHEKHCYAKVDGIEVTFNEEGKAILIPGMFLKIAEATQEIVDYSDDPEGTKFENTPAEDIEISSFGPLEQFAMSAFQGIINSMGTNPLELTSYQISQASDKAWTMANAMMNSATAFKKQHKLKSATYPGVHNTVNASRTDQLLADIAKQLVELNNNLSVDITKIKDIDDEKLALGIGNEDPENPWEEPEPDLNENEDDEKKEAEKNPNLYSISELLFLQRRELKDLASYCRIKETDEELNTTVIPLIDVVKNIQDALWQETPSGDSEAGSEKKSYIDVISEKLDNVLSVLKMPDGEGTQGDSITKVLSDTLSDIGRILGIPEDGQEESGGIMNTLNTISDTLDGVRGSLVTDGLLGDKTAAEVLVENRDKLDSVGTKLDTIGSYLTYTSGGSTTPIASLVNTSKSHLSNISSYTSNTSAYTSNISSYTSSIRSTTNTISSNVSTIKSDTSTIKSDVGTIKTDAASIKDNTSTTATNTGTTNSKLDTANSKLDTINTTITNK